MRYFRLYWSFLRLNTQRALAYRANFGFGLFITAIESLAVFATVGVLFSHIPDIQGWDYSHMLIITGIFMLTNSVSWLVFRASVEKLDQLISQGGFDFYLVKPISSQFLVSINRIDIVDSSRGLVGLGLISMGLQQAAYVPSIWAILSFLVAFICGEIILYSLQILLKTISFKSIQGWGSNNIFYRLQDTTQFPLTIYRGFARIIFTTIIPIIFVTTVPAQLLLGTANPLWLLWSIIAASSILFISTLVWKFTVRSYSSASS